MDLNNVMCVQANNLWKSTLNANDIVPHWESTKQILSMLHGRISPIYALNRSITSPGHDLQNYNIWHVDAMPRCLPEIQPPFSSSIGSKSWSTSASESSICCNNSILVFFSTSLPHSSEADLQSRFQWPAYLQTQFPYKHLSLQMSPCAQPITASLVHLT